MKAIDYLKKIGIDEKSTKQICFVIGEVFGENHSKQFYYRSSPLRTACEWFDFLNHAANPKMNVLNFNVLNIKQPVVSWLSGANWNYGIENGNYISLLVISDEQLGKYYSENQWKQTVQYIEYKIN